MFLLVSVRHVGAHPGEHQHGVSIQISINLGKTFLRISRIGNIDLGPVVRTPVRANPGLNFNPGFFFFLSKALSRIIFSLLCRVSNHQIVNKET